MTECRQLNEKVGLPDITVNTVSKGLRLNSLRQFSFKCILRFLLYFLVVLMFWLYSISLSLMCLVNILEEKHLFQIH